MQTHVSHSFEFVAGGNAAPIQVAGWSVAESQHTWCVGTTSSVAIENVVAPHGFFLEVLWHPFVSFPYRPDQSVLITINGHRVSPYRLAQRETAAFYCPPPKPTDKKILITFEHPDVAKIADYVETTDPREVAVAFRRLRILPLASPPPMRITNGSALKVGMDGDHVTIPGSDGGGHIALRELSLQFEMLAGNCDLGLAMRTLGVEQLSLLRFGGASPESAMRGLENDFDGLGEQQTTEIANNPIKEWMIRDGFGLRFHTHQSSETVTEADVLKRQRKHVQFLRRKFLEDVSLGEKIFVFADHVRPHSFEAALALFLALNRKAPNRMLWVCPNLTEMARGRVDEVVPGLARGSLDLFGGPLEAGHIAVSGWINVLFNASVVLHRGRPPSEC